LPSRRSERRRRVVESSIRTKLTAVILQVELALESGDDDRLRDCLHAALDAAWAADALLD
jgi:hypothetical protein